ncbi:MAG: RNA methyltransferase [Dorea sp.]|nr:RNA methyltransferase [Dorea sp.]
MITSHTNQKVKRLLNLMKKKKAREEEKVFLVEGIRMFREMPKDKILEAYVSESFYKKEKNVVDEVLAGSRAKLEIMADSVYERVSDTKTPQGVMGVVKQPEYHFEKIVGEAADTGREVAEPHLVILENLQDPGNLGTIFRTAEAAGVTGILLSKDSVDIYNPKVIRSTMGAIFRMPFVYVEDIHQAIKAVKAAGIRTYAAHLEDSVDYDVPDYKLATAFLIGNEGNGLTRETADLCDQYIKIPMAGKVESLNAAIAATILMYEASRQRRH